MGRESTLDGSKKAATNNPLPLRTHTCRRGPLPPSTPRSERLSTSPPPRSHILRAPASPALPSRLFASLPLLLPPLPRASQSAHPGLFALPSPLLAAGADRGRQREDTALPASLGEGNSPRSRAIAAAGAAGDTAAAAGARSRPPRSKPLGRKGGKVGRRWWRVSKEPTRVRPNNKKTE